VLFECLLDNLGEAFGALAEKVFRRLDNRILVIRFFLFLGRGAGAARAVKSMSAIAARIMTVIALSFSSPGSPGRQGHRASGRSLR